MGMANSDNDLEIIAEHQLMEKIRQIHPPYAYDTVKMTEDQKIIYDAGTLKKYVQFWNE